MLGFFVLSSCDTSTEPEPDILDVSGTYTGEMIYRFSLLDAPVAVTSALRLNVAQSGMQVTITGTETFLGEATTFPAVTGEINETGFFNLTGGGSLSTYRDTECGQITTTSSTLTFSKQTLRIQETVVTDQCGDISASALLEREG